MSVGQRERVDFSSSRDLRHIATSTGRHTTALRYSAALLLFAVAIAASFHSVLAHPGSAIPAGFNDATNTLRDYWAASVQHRNPFTLKHDALIGAPAGLDLTPATTLANGGIQTAFVWLLRDPLGLIGAWNAFMFLGLLATCLATFALLDGLGCTFIASLFGSYVFGLSPYAFERARFGHLGLLHNWVFPLLAAALIRLHERRSLGWAAAVGATVGVAFYLSAYQGLLAAFMAFVFFGVEVVRGRRSRLRAAGLAGAAYLVSLLTLVPVLVVYEHERAHVQVALSHDSLDVYRYAASLLAYVLPSPRNPIFHWLRGVHPDDPAEQTLFVGYSTLVLALVAVALLITRDRWFRISDVRRWFTLSAAILVPAAFLMSLAPRRTLGPVSIPLPSLLLAHVSSYWRVYSRFGLLVGFALAVLAAFALTALSKRPGQGWRLLAPVALAVAVLELLPGNIQAFDTNARPDWVSWLASEPRGIVATYPMDILQLNTRDRWYQSLDDDPRFGYGIFGPVDAVRYSRNEAIRLLAHDLADPLTASILSTEGVRYVVVHDDVYRANKRGVPNPDPTRFGLLRRFGGVRIFSVHAPRVDVAAALLAHQSELATLQGLEPPGLTFGDGFNAPELYNGAPSHWMIQDGELEIDNSGPAMQVIVTGFAFSNQHPRTLEVQDDREHVLARQAISTSDEPLHLGPLRIGHGRSTLILVARTGPAPLGPSDPRMGSVFLSQILLQPVAVYSRANRPLS